MKGFLNALQLMLAGFLIAVVSMHIGIAMAGDITDRGMSQRDLFLYLEDVSERVNDVIDTVEGIAVALDGNATVCTSLYNNMFALPAGQSVNATSWQDMFVNGSLADGNGTTNSTYVLPSDLSLTGL